jgi:hypothetical protein
MLLAVVAMGVFWYIPRGFSQAAGNNDVRPAITQSSGPYTVKGNQILDSKGSPYLFHGVGRDSLEYDCTGDGFFDSQHLSYMGYGHNGNGITYWDANTVRLPVTEGYWFNAFAPKKCTPAIYQQFIKNTVDALTKLNLNVIIDLQWTDAGGQATGGGAAWSMPDSDSVKFWTQVATTYASYSNVVFELFNEPHPTLGDWKCWQTGCAITGDSSYVVDCNCMQTWSYQAVGMQALVNAVRGAGANNLVLVAGMDWGYDLSGIVQNPITGSNVVYDTHPYPYQEKQPSTWDASFGNISKTYPVISAENGQYDCATNYMSRLFAYFDAHSIGWVGWAWAISGSSPCGYPQLITDFNGTPAPNTGVLIYQYLTSYANNTLLPGPISSTWYFAEGKVGQGFTEWLTIQNPDPVNACTVNIQYLSSTGSYTVTRTVNAKTRYTASVNSDLGTPSGSSSSKSDSIIVKVTNPTRCFGVVAERPIYFNNYFGESSGDDALGESSLSKAFYFADMPTTTGAASFITILNPPGGSTATVTATYYAAGQSVGTSTANVPSGTRQTIVPPHFSQRVIAVVTSTQPVAMERPTYFSNFPAGNVGNGFGAASVQGAKIPQNEWMFAEGYVAAGWQEYLVIANPDPTNQATVNIKLEFTGQPSQSYQVNVGSKSQLIWNVNAHASGNVSADVTSNGAGIVVERELFFHTSGSFSVYGATDVTGEVGPVASRSFSFAEGYTNRGFAEWLTLQNPTGSTENITVNMVNGYGNTYTYNVSMPPGSRATSDINTIVAQHLYHSGEGSAGYNVSMTVQSSGYFVAERPMYWNVGFTQGGSDVIGYTGL